MQTIANLPSARATPFYVGRVSTLVARRNPSLRMDSLLFILAALRATYSYLCVGTPHMESNHLIRWYHRPETPLPACGFRSYSSFYRVGNCIYYCELAVYGRDTFNFRSMPYATGLYPWKPTPTFM